MADSSPSAADDADAPGDGAADASADAETQVQADDGDVAATESASADAAGSDATSGDAASGVTTGDEDIEALRREVEEKYDFDEFGPADMAEMNLDEWEAVFDPDSWIIGTELLDRVEADLKQRIANGDVFAVVERLATDGERLVAYSDEGYAIVYPDGSVEGEGTVLRDVKPTVALCSMEDYDVPEVPPDAGLPAPEEVPQGSGELGNLMLQVIAGAQILAGVGLLVMWLIKDLTLVAAAAALGFIVIGLVLLVTVANARLSDRFRAEEYRNRLRAVNAGTDARPDFLPPLEDAGTDATDSDSAE